MTLIVAATLLLAAAPAAQKPPRLGVLLVVDQLGSADLEALSIDGEADFGGLLARGAAHFDALYPYVGTETGPGHATLATSALPSVHGICANTWFTEGKKTYCVDDPSQPVLGGKPGEGRSARFLMAPTLGDTLKSRSAKSKVVSISLKDRAAILMGGPSADLALWYDHNLGRWTTSKAYAEALPAWAEKLADRPAQAFASGKWSPLPQVAKRGITDAREGEDSPDGFGPAFPHDLMTLPKEKQVRAYRYTPHSVEDTLSLAIAALDGEGLGKHEGPDLLLVSISATDYSGHAWGPGSVEKVDIIERTGVEIRRLVTELDKRLGKGGWAMVVTADHGAAPLAEALKGQKIPGGRLLEVDLLRDAVLGFTAEQKKRFQGLSPPVIFLELNGLNDKDREAMIEGTRKNLSAVKGVRKAVRTDGPETADNALSRGSVYEGRCGPLFVELAPFVVFTETPHPLGTDHASGNVYDRRVPMYVLGPNVNGGRHTAGVDPRDAAPTLAAMLGIPPPDRGDGRPVPALLPRR